MKLSAEQLQRILDERRQEGLYLDFKRGNALSRQSAARTEMVKDCTGFANAAGGTLLYVPDP